MPKLKVLSVFGTRPEAVKMAPVVRELQRRADRVESRVVVTAQHRQMLDQVLELFALKPDHDLRVMETNQTPTGVAAAVLSRLEPILREERPDWVLVQGDTTTVAAASLAGFYAGAKVGHVEAGLRTYDRRQPFPEEINRRIAGVTADLHFAPTRGAAENLLREGIPAGAVAETGNPVIDALLWARSQPATAETRALLERLAVGGKRHLVLVTAHRRENFGVPLESICGALGDLARLYGDSVRIVYPVHLNPNVREPVHRLLGHLPNVVLLPPLDYLPLVHLMDRATLVLTDSGGIQEEAPSLGVPVLVLREVTERPEAVERGTVRLVGTDRVRIVAEACRLLDDDAERERMSRSVNPYGDGKASQRIVSALLGEPFAPFRPEPASGLAPLMPCP